MGDLPLGDGSVDVSHLDAETDLGGRERGRARRGVGRKIWGGLAVVWLDLEEGLDGCFEVLEGGGDAGFEEEGVAAGCGEDGVEVVV